MDELFIVILGGFLTVLLGWGFTHLQAEHWQFIGSVPVRKTMDGSWEAVNLTYYGFFSATAYLIATAVLCILLGSLSIPVTTLVALAVCMLGVCVPASRWIAKIVEKKAFTFSVQGACFVGILMAPWTIVLVNQLMAHFPSEAAHPPLDVMVILSAIAPVYAIGEGVGRLSCISFGCCYGKPLATSTPLFQKLFSKRHLTFRGGTKKIAYADGLDEIPTLPIQALTAGILCLTGVAGIYLFLKGHYAVGFAGVMILTQAWRFVSEFMRADFRGGGRISAYQIMGCLAVAYALGLVWVFPVAARPGHDLGAGLRVLWTPAMILFLQGLWAATFLYTGRSRVTAATLSFHVVRENI
jgi:prolipoprotein diacylglyceryltransferase